MKWLPLLSCYLLIVVLVHAYPAADKAVVEQAAGWGNPTSEITSGSSSPPATATASRTLSSSSSKITTTSSPSPSTSDLSNQHNGYPIYGDDNNITTQMGVLGALFIVLGLYLAFFGFRGFRVTLAAFGFLAFGLVTWVGMTNCQPSTGYINDQVTMIVVPAGIGVAGAILFFIFWNIGFYLIGAVGGLALALYICCWKEDLVIESLVARACFLAAMSVAFAALTFFLERYVILFSTSFVGAYIFFVGVDALARTGYIAGIRTIIDRNPLHSVTFVLSRNVYILLAFTIVLFLVSFGWQLILNRGRYFGIRYLRGNGVDTTKSASGASEDAETSAAASHHASRAASPSATAPSSPPPEKDNAQASSDHHHSHNNDDDHH